MSFPKQMKDNIFALLQEPTLDNFRTFLKGQTGEHNTIDFKGEWIRKDKLAKEILSIANCGGGIIVFGVKENDDKTFQYGGLSEIIDKADIYNETKSYLPSELKYEIYDFSYNDSEYEALKGRKYQMVVVSDTPEFLPFISEKQGADIKNDVIYIRRGTTCQIANKSELEGLIRRRINHIYPNNGQPLELQEHLAQLKVLYSNIDKNKHKLVPGSSVALTSISQAIAQIASYGKGFGEYETVRNPLYPDESYEEFVARMILAKKKKIERVLDLH